MVKILGVKGRLLVECPDGGCPVDCLAEVAEDGRLGDGLEPGHLPPGAGEVDLQEDVVVQFSTVQYSTVQLYSTAQTCRKT